VNWLEHTRNCSLNPQEIDLQDSTYCIPCFSSVEPLVRSVEKLGIVNAPVVQERSGAILTPVLGRRRLLAAVQLGMPQVEVRKISADMPEQDGFALAFWDNLGHRILDAAATALVVKRLLTLFPRQQVASRFLPALGVPAHGPRIERLTAVGGLEMRVLEALASGGLQEKTAWVLSRIQATERLDLLKLTESLGLNANKKHEVIAGLFDISVHRNEPICTLLDRNEARSILSDHDIPVPERAARFRELVRSWKFPERVRRERDFRTQMDSVCASSRVSVCAVPGFESPQCTIEIRCDSPEHAVKTLSCLRDRGGMPD
jgi:ParB-like chromosome segregation protein Spo0J